MTATEYVYLIKMAEKSPPRPRRSKTKEKLSMIRAFYDELDKITAHETMRKEASAFFAAFVGREKKAGIFHAIGVEAKKEARGILSRAARRGTRVAESGAVAYVGGRAMSRRTAKREEATKTATLAPSLHSVMQSPFTIKSQAIKKPATGLLKFSKKAPEEEWKHPGSSVWDRHKGKIVGTLALATAAGVGAKLMHGHWKAKRTPPPLPKPPPPEPLIQTVAPGNRPKPKPVRSKLVQDQAGYEAAAAPRYEKARRKKRLEDRKVRRHDED